MGQLGYSQTAGKKENGAGSDREHTLAFNKCVRQDMSTMTDSECVDMPSM